MNTRTARQRRVIELAMNAAGADDDCEAFAVIRALASDLAELEPKLAAVRQVAWYSTADAEDALADIRAILDSDKGET